MNTKKKILIIKSRPLIDANVSPYTIQVFFTIIKSRPLTDANVSPHTRQVFLQQGSLIDARLSINQCRGVP